jgi:L-asparaginase / beta-aspartyl-peptidase
MKKKLEGKHKRQSHSPLTKRGSEVLFSLAIHGGAGNERKKLSPAMKRGKKEALWQALDAGYQILHKGGSSLDAVQASVVILENSEFFNAAKGAVLTKDKTVELDASIMGSDLRGGAVGAVKKTKNPILLAREVMEYTPCVLLVGEKADQFASKQRLEKVPNAYFITKRRLQAWLKAEEREKEKNPQSDENELGTVGAVALDQKGHLAAATSTGGINFKMAGRIGDSALIGAGTYATGYCAVSCTGQGEAFIRLSTASFVCQLVRLGVSLEEAARRAIFEEISSIGGKGGLIAIDHLGSCAMPFNTLSMCRGYWQKGGKPIIYSD